MTEHSGKQPRFHTEVCMCRFVQVLSAQKILSAPVMACSDSDTPDDCTDVIGFVDIRDILVSFLSGTCKPEINPQVNLHFESLFSGVRTTCTACQYDTGLDIQELQSQHMLQCMHLLEEAGNAFGKKRLQDLSELGMLNLMPAQLSDDEHRLAHSSAIGYCLILLIILLTTHD